LTDTAHGEIFLSTEGSAVVNYMNIDILSVEGASSREGLTVSEGVTSTNGFKVYPNPFDGNIRVRLNDSMDDMDFNLSLYDLFGEKVLSNNFSDISSEITLSTETIKAGTYYLMISNGESIVYTETIIKVD